LTIINKYKSNYADITRDYRLLQRYPIRACACLPEAQMGVSTVFERHREVGGAGVPVSVRRGQGAALFYVDGNV